MAAVEDTAHGIGWPGTAIYLEILGAAAGKAFIARLAKSGFVC